MALYKKATAKAPRQSETRASSSFKLQVWLAAVMIMINNDNLIIITIIII